MKIVIFGASSDGRLIVQEALGHGHVVCAFARDPTKVGIEHPRLKVAQGDALDPATVEAAVRGQDAVICALGAGDSRGNLNFFWKQWTIVRQGAFTDGPRTGLYRHGFPPKDSAITHKISRATSRTSC